jgi:predicted alpha/beta superfamily hydrolase
MRHNGFRMIAVGILVMSPSLSLAKDPTLPLPIRTEQLKSAKLGEIREFWVSLPDQYATSGEKYPVLYMMDGEYNFTSGLIGGVRYLESLEAIPEFIIVGIKNTDRSKDVFPEEITFGDGSKGGGRANQYLAFLREELIPYVDKTYRTEPYRVLFGTSSSAFTTVYALFTTPELASTYIAASATLMVPQFHNNRDTLIHGYKGGKRQLCLVMGENDYPTIISLNGALKEKIGSFAPSGLSCRFITIGHGEHVPANALTEGLLGVFSGWAAGYPLTEDNFPQIKALADERLSRFGIAGKIPEERLKNLAETLLGEKKLEKALAVMKYRVQSYPRSVDACIGLGDVYRQAGQAANARESYTRALVLEPANTAAMAKLKELGQ